MQEYGFIGSRYLACHRLHLQRDRDWRRSGKASQVRHRKKLRRLRSESRFTSTLR